MVSYGNISIRDYSEEVSRTQIITPDITSANMATILSQWATLRAAIDAITLGVVSQESLQLFNNKLSNLSPTDENAQVERKWLVTYEDVTEFFDPPTNLVPNPSFRRIYTLEIGTADFSAIPLLPRSDEGDLNAGPAVAFINAFETLCRAPSGGNVNVLSIRHVGARR